MARIIISAGHTAKNPGSVKDDLREVDLTRAIARKIIPHLRASGVITLSVPPDLDLSKRIDWINGTGYAAKFNDIAIEIHINDGGKSGFEFWFGGKAESKSKQLTKQVMTSVTSSTGLENQGMRNHKKHEFGSLAFIEQTNTISAILECLYIDNSSDIAKLKNESEVDKIAKGIAKGILKFLNIEFKEASKPQEKQQSQQSQPSQKSQTAPNNQYSPPPGQKRIMNKTEREQMVMGMYQRILGRNPTQNDMNYFLNISINEDDLLKRMVSSQEHLDMVKSAQEYIQMKNRFENQNVNITRLQVESNDKNVMLNNYKQLLHQKNQHISKLNAQVHFYRTQGQVPGKKKVKEPKKREYKGTFSDRFFHFFSRILN